MNQKEKISSTKNKSEEQKKEQKLQAKLLTDLCKKVVDE